MTILLVGPILLLAGLLIALAWLHLGSGPDPEQERERLRRAALREAIRDEMEHTWLNGPVLRRRRNRHDRARRRGYTEAV